LKRHKLKLDTIQVCSRSRKN